MTITMSPTRSMITKSSDNTSQNGIDTEDPINLSTNWINHAVQCDHCKKLLKSFLQGNGGGGNKN